MTAYREGSGIEARRVTVRAKVAPRPARSEWPLAAAFFGTIAMMLVINGLLNAFPG